MNYGAVKYCDIANGAGVRTSLFVSGCTHHCRGCFQPETWDFGYGHPFDPTIQGQILESLKPDYISGLTVLGGEPMEPENQRALLPFLKLVKENFPSKNVWLYTGDVLEDLLDEGSERSIPETLDLLACVDIMVDGLFVEELKDISLRFKGSANQRILDIPASLAAGHAVLWQDQAVYASHSMD